MHAAKLWVRYGSCGADAVQDRGKKQLQIPGPWAFLNHLRQVSLSSVEVSETLNVGLIPAPVPLCSGSTAISEKSSGVHQPPWAGGD